MVTLLLHPTQEITVTPILVTKSPRNGSMLFSDGEPVTVRCTVQPASMDTLNRSSSTVEVDDGVKPTNMVVVYTKPDVMPDVLHSKMNFLGDVYFQKGRLAKHRTGSHMVWHDQVTYERGTDVG